MKSSRTELPGVLIIESDVHRDARGNFAEVYHIRRFEEFGISETFVQDNVSWSNGCVIRGLHYQEPHAQGKLVSVIQGAVFDVAVDIRRDSPTFKKWTGIELRPEEGRMLWIPPGFAHGFATLTETAAVSYKVTNYWSPDTEHGIIWNDPDLAIDWPVDNPILSEKDSAAPCLSDAITLPRYAALT